MTGDAATSTGQTETNRGHCTTERAKKTMSETKIKRSPAIDQRVFDMVKTLLAGKATNNEIADYTGLSLNTIIRIKRVENFTEYKNMMTAIKLEYNRKQEEKKKVKEQSEQEQQIVEAAPTKPINVTVQTTYYVSQKMDKIVELLTAISAKIAFVVDELTGIPAKKEAE